MPIPAGYTQNPNGTWTKTSDSSGPYAWDGVSFWLLSTGVAGGGVPADYTQHPSGFWFKTADGSGPYSYDGTNFYLMGNGGPSGSATFSTLNFTTALKGANGSVFDLYNTADQTTNYERVSGYWSSNVFHLNMQRSGTGVNRELRIGNTAASYIRLGVQSGAGIRLGNGGGSWTAASGTELAEFSAAGSSGTQTLASVAPIINQSGTAGYTALDINPTETATGSGTKLLFRCAVAGVAKAQITNAGALTLTGGITHGSTTLLTTTVSLTNGAAAAAGTLGNAPVAGNPTKWVPINDNGTTRYIPAW